MSYQQCVDSLSQHGKGLLVEHAVVEASLAIISLKGLRRVGMRLGDLAKTQQFIGVAKRPRDDVHGRVAETASRASPNFTSVQEASQCPNLREDTVDGLSTAVKRYNEDCIKEALVSGVKKLMVGFDISVDKRYIPLMRVLGASGQGKTDALNFIRKDAGIQDLVINAISEHEETLKCKHVIPLFAAFNQSSAYDHKEATKCAVQPPSLELHWSGV